MMIMIEINNVNCDNDNGNSQNSTMLQASQSRDFHQWLEGAIQSPSIPDVALIIFEHL